MGIVIDDKYRARHGAHDHFRVSAVNALTGLGAGTDAVGSGWGFGADIAGVGKLIIGWGRRTLPSQLRIAGLSGIW
jgi:hypothetical protein